MIRLYFGNVGSGKTVHAVRDMYLTKNRMATYSNIKTKKLKNSKLIDGSMIIKREIVDHKKKRDGTVVPVEKLKLNSEFWREKSDEPLSVILDEAHNILNARRAMSKVNQLVNPKNKDEGAVKMKNTTILIFPRNFPGAPSTKVCNSTLKGTHNSKITNRVFIFSTFMNNYRVN